MQDNTKILLTLIISVLVVGVSTYKIIEKEDKVSARAWQAFESYIAYAEAHNLEGISSLSHQLSDTCLDPELTEECYALMDNVVLISKEFDKTEFVNVWRDRKQIVLSTDWQVEENEVVKGYYRNVIYFTRDWKGSPKLLSMSAPIDFVYLPKEGLSPEELDKMLQEKIVDTDKDGLDDEVENCTFTGAPTECEYTDPLKRDSNNNGWWDSTESLFR